MRLVVLPNVFPSGMLTVGQLVQNPLAPAANPYISATPVKPDELSQVRSETPFRTLVSVDKRGRLSSVMKHNTARNVDVLSVEADEIVYRSLKNPKEAFSSLCEDASARRWIIQMARYRKPFYFIVGLQELTNAKLKKLGAQDGARTEASINGYDSINGVLGIEVMKAQGRIGRSDEPHPIEDIYWTWSYHKLGGASAEDDKQLSIGLGDVVQPEELCQFDAEEGSDTSYQSSEED